ncbi:MAG: phage tail tube protein [Candidatus Asgardarchaeum sp.]
MALPHNFWNAPPAYMGFVGFVRVLGGIIQGNSDGISAIQHGNYLIRATTADINLTQEITKPDVVDSRYDRTVYQLGPKLVDGTVAFPAVYEVPTGEDYTLFEILYRYAVTRTNAGVLSPFDIDVKYAASNSLPHNESEFRYTGCIVNTWQFAVSQSDVVTCSVDVIGVNRETIGAMDAPARSADSDGSDACEGSSTSETATIGTTRIITWNDARVELSGGRLTAPIGGQYVRSFEANINNDAERYYTLNTKLFAQAIAPRKREITGNVVLMGRHPILGNVALSNEDNCTESAKVKFGFTTEGTGEGCSAATFGVTLPNCVFEIEEMSLTNDIFESTVNWHALPAAGTGVCDPMLTTLANTVFTYEASA